MCNDNSNQFSRHVQLGIVNKVVKKLGGRQVKCQRPLTNQIVKEMYRHGKLKHQVKAESRRYN